MELKPRPPPAPVYSCPTKLPFASGWFLTGKKGPPPDQDQLSADLHCIHLSVDGLVYVCDRDLNRIHVFTKQGRFITNFLVAGNTIARGPECGGPGRPTLGMCGSTFNLVFSHDADQKYVLVVTRTVNYLGWGTIRRYGRGAFQPCG